MTKVMTGKCCHELGVEVQSTSGNLSAAVKFSIAVNDSWAGPLEVWVR